MVALRKARPCKICVPNKKNKVKAVKNVGSTLRRSDAADYDFCSALRVPGIGNVNVRGGNPAWLPKKVRAFVCEKAAVMRPSEIRICNGSVFEADMILSGLEQRGIAEKLSAYDNVYLVRTDPKDTARTEKNTFICTATRSEVETKRTGPGENEFARFISREQLSIELDKRFPGCMRGRIMYVIPFSMGPIAGKNSLYGVQLTDSPYVVVNMRMVTRVCSSVWDAMGESNFIRCVHSVGVPRPITRKLVREWACNTENVLVAHVLPDMEVYSYGSGYGGNSLLGKKCISLRIASYIGYREGWLAEHAALLSLTDPKGKEIFICVSFPSGGGKTVLAFMKPALPDWKIQVLGDDITWLRFNPDGQLYAMAPENGMFGIAAETKLDSGKLVIDSISHDSLIVNCASTSKGKFFWDSLESQLEPKESVIDWKGQPWKPGCGQPAVHPNCRFTILSKNVKHIHPDWETKAVPVSAYIFGSKRPDGFPLVMQADSWHSGVVLAAASRTKTGTTSDKQSSDLVHDPMSMRPFLSYNFANYVRHWIDLEKSTRKMPDIFFVNWYQEGADGKPIWPGYGENIRVLEWIFNRATKQQTEVVTSPVGIFPKELNLAGLRADVDMSNLISFNKEFWEKELVEMKRFYNEEMAAEERPTVVDRVLNKFTEGLK